MAYSSTLYLAAESPSAPYASMPPGTDRSVSPFSLDLRVARTSKANLFVVGSDRMVANVLSVAVPNMAQCTVIRCKDGRLLLPPVSLRPGTLVVRDVEALTADDQRELLEWMDAVQYRTQVISTTSRPLLERVEAGDFNDTLYYRLNKIYVELSE